MALNLAQIIRQAVSVANDLTISVQATVVHKSVTGSNVFGEVTYGSPVNRPAIVEQKQHLLQLQANQTVMTKAKVTFLVPVVIDPKDEIILPDGTTGPIVNVEGLTDKDTNQPYFAEVWLG